MPTIAAAVGCATGQERYPRRRLVAVDVKGKPVLYELPAAVAAKPSRVAARLIYYAFDVLYLDG